MKRLFLDLLRAVGLYLAFVVGGVLCFLSLAPVVGYIPYSDRPGPGWVGRFPGVSWSEFLGGLMFQVGWATLLLPYAAVIGVILFAVARGMERIGAPRAVVATLSALLAGLVSGYIVAGIGWCIAIAAPPIYFAMALGAVFGAWCLPTRIRSSPAGPQG